MKNYIKICLTLILVIISFAFMAIGVYAAISVTHTTSGKISFIVEDVFVDISQQVMAIKPEHGGNLSYSNTAEILGLAISGDNFSSNMQNVFDSENNIIIEQNFSSYNNNIPLSTNTESQIDIDFDQSTVWVFKFNVNNMSSENVFMKLTASSESINVLCGGTTYSGFIGEKTFFVVIALSNVMYDLSNINYEIKFNLCSTELSTPSENFQYDILDNGTISIKDINANVTDLVIPSHIKIDGVIYPVTEIADNSFNGNKNIQSVIFPDTIERIGNYAFNACSNLVDVKIPQSVNLLGDYCFQVCTSLEQIHIPNGVQVLGLCCFFGCSSLKIMYLPASVNEIENSAFSACLQLKEIYVDENNQNYSALNNILYNKDFTTLVYVPAAREDSNLVIPEGVTQIGDFCVSNCFALQEVYFPSTLEVVGDNIFSGCQNISKINISINNKNFFIENNILYNKDKSILYYYCSAKIESTFQLPNTVLEIHSGAFNSALNLVSINFNENLLKINDFAFYYCVNLESVNFPENIDNIPFKCFTYCSSLNNIVIPSNITFIGRAAFDHNTNLTSVVFENANNWYIFDTSYADKISISVDNAATNAANLTENYRYKFWINE